MTKRLNITLPERTVALMDRVAGKGQRSRLIAEAVERYVEESEAWRDVPRQLRATVGAEIRKTRPALVLQNDIANRYSPLTIVAAVTSKFDEMLYPTEVLVTAPEGGLSVDSVILLKCSPKFRQVAKV
jgi:hypothetical protein